MKKQIGTETPSTTRQNTFRARNSGGECSRSEEEAEHHKTSTSKRFGPVLLQAFDCPRAAHVLWGAAGISALLAQHLQLQGFEAVPPGWHRQSFQLQQIFPGMQKSEEQKLSCLTVEVWERFCVLFFSALTAAGERGGDKAFLGNQMSQFHWYL